MTSNLVCGLHQVYIYSLLPISTRELLHSQCCFNGSCEYNVWRKTSSLKIGVSNAFVFFTRGLILNCDKEETEKLHRLLQFFSIYGNFFNSSRNLRLLFCPALFKWVVKSAQSATILFGTRPLLWEEPETMGSATVIFAEAILQSGWAGIQTRTPRQESRALAT